VTSYTGKSPVKGQAEHLLLPREMLEREMLELGLQTLGHSTCVAHDGPTALVAAKNFQPDVALLDIGLPAMDGYELSRRMQHELGSRAPILVAVTGYGQETDRARSRLAGFAYHLAKPIELEALEVLLASTGPS
jgi:CheY-like chemotaxis protein